MRKIFSYLIAVMMVFTMMPYTAFAEAENLNKDIALGAPQEIAVDLFVNSKVKVESSDTNVARAALTGNALVISSGAAIYRTSIRIMPVKTGTAKITVKADGEVKAVYNINVVPAQKILESHADEKPVIEYVSYFDGELTNTNTDNVKATVISKTKRITSENVNGMSLKETQYVYKIQIEYKALGEYDFTLIGSKSGEFYNVSGIATDHKWTEELVVDKEPSCTEEGSKAIHCKLCDLTKNPAVIPATGHEFGEWSVEKEATCFDEGTMRKECAGCGTIEQKCVAQLEHEYKWVIDNPATVESAGVKHEECALCGSVRSEGTVVDQLNHAHQLTKVEETAATCTDSGVLQHYSCSECESVFSDEAGQLTLTKEELITEPLGHSYGDWTVDVAPKCDAEGSRYKTCQRCEDKVTEKIPAIEHIIEIVPASNATCTKNGRTESERCINCNRILVVPKVIPATGHTFETEWSHNDKSHWHGCHCGERMDEADHTFKWIIDRESTETAPGLKHEECTVCDAVRNKDTVIEQLNHTHTMINIKPVPATCSEDGNIEYYYCAGCKNSYLDKDGKQIVKAEKTVLKATGHTYGKWLVRNKPTCSRIGYEFNSCSVCGLAEIRELPLIEHEIEESTILATCTTDGANIASCKNCKYKAEYVIPAFGHKTRWLPAVAPTCTKEGATSSIKCTTCGEYTSPPKPVPATGHTYENWIIDTASTCAVEGSKHRVCKTCKAVDNAAVEKLPHTPEIIPAIEATCSKVGMTEGTYCKVCSVIIKAQEIIPMHDHSWETEYVVDITSTINRDGSMSYHCADCNISQPDSKIVIPRIKKTTVGSLVYNGAFQEPSVKVVDYAGKELDPLQYDVTYKGSDGEDITKPQAVGSYKAKVTFTGLYSGYTVKTFKVNPKATVITKLTKPAKKQIKVTWNKRTKQVTGYQIRCCIRQNMYNARYVSVNSFNTNTKLIKQLKSGKKYYVQIRTYKTVDGQKYYSAWSAKKTIVTK